MTTIRHRIGELKLHDMKAGDPINLGLTFNFDLTGYHDWAAQIRDAPAPGGKVLAAWSVDPYDPEPNRTIWFRMPGSLVTLLLDGGSFDFQALDTSDEPHTFIEGEITIDPEYTQ